MKTLIATAGLTIMFLSAGAFAGNSDSYAPDAAVVQDANLTVINKNMTWPLAGQITVESCRFNRCFDV